VYSTCLFCNHALGRNEVLESFPVGRRLAFDAAKGRLWVVCRNCERWNLSPLEERWEAFEACERLFRDTRVRMSTDQIGLARLPEGLELVRIGAPLRPEFAAWRYGDQFGRRRRRAILLTGAGIAAFAGLTIGAAAVGISVGGLGGMWNVLFNIPVRARLRTEDGRILKVRHSHLRSARLLRDPDGGWVASVKVRRLEQFTGPEAEHAAAVLLPALNQMAGSRKSVQGAVSAIEAAGHPEAYLAHMGSQLPPFDPSARRPSKAGRLDKLPAETRLAVEMALHEEQERRALAGELIELEMAWRAAEEIAAIADNLFVPPEHEAFIARHRAGGGTGEAVDETGKR
jgi:hypothetical protein